jgi:hypothetical protein
MNEFSPLRQTAYAVILLAAVGAVCHGQMLDTARALPPRYSTHKKVIEFGWGMLSAAQVRDNMASLSQRPFDGLVFLSRWPQYSAGFPQSIFYPVEVSEEYMQLDTLASINWSTTLTDNFLRFWVTGPSHADWFNDGQWAIVTENLERVSKASAAARTKGIFLDTEHYDSNVWRYNRTLYPAHTLAQVQARVRQRGREFIQALQRHSPDIRVFCTGAWIFPNWEAKGNLDSIQNTSYCLLKSFSDGMLEGCGRQAMVIDGNEIGYYFRNTINWHYGGGAYNIIARNPFIAPELNARSGTNMQVGHGLMYSTYKPISSETNSRRLEHHVYEELLCSDEYMWFYTEEGEQFWLDAFPGDAAAAIRSAKKRIASGEALGFAVSSETVVTYSSDLQITSPSQGQTFDVGDTITFQVQEAPAVRDVTYFTSYNRLSSIAGSPALYRALAVHPGSYLVYASSNAYLKLSNPVTYQVQEPSSGIHVPAVKQTIRVYPNPAGSAMTIRIDAPVEHAEIDILDDLGRTIESVKDARQEMVIDTGRYPDGLFFVRLVCGDRARATDTFVVIH